MLLGQRQANRLGMIIGEFSMAVFWTVMHMAFGTSAPDFPWP